MSIEISMQDLQSQAQQLLLNSGYHRSLVRYHTMMSEDFEHQVDVVAKKIRNLEANTPKPQEETQSNGSSNIPEQKAS